MKFSILAIAVIALAIFSTVSAKAVSNEDGVDKTEVVSKKVYIQNYDIAETDYSWYQGFNLTGGLGKFGFRRSLTPVTSNVQPIVRANRDTLYGVGIFDLNCPVTIELPPNKGRYLSLLALDNEDYPIAVLHSTETKSANITFSYPKADKTKCPNHSHEDSSDDIKSETRYISTIFRVFIDPNDPADIAEANRLQDAIKATQISVGEWTYPNWNLTSLVQVRNSLAALMQFLEPLSQVTGYRNTTDPTLHLIGTAAGIGGNPPEEAVYSVKFPPALIDLNQVYYIDIELPSSIPINNPGFWSVTVYNDKGYLQYNDASSYSVNGITAKPESDGSIRIYFSNTRGADMKNWLYIYPGWNYLIRLYLPQAPILTHTWTFPALQEFSVSSKSFSIKLSSSQLLISLSLILTFTRYYTQLLKM